MMKRLIPVFAQIFAVFALTFSVFAACPTIDDIDFLQESICDGVDMVEVCYEVTDTDGDSIFVEFSLNTGDTTINLTTTYEDVPGYYGPQMGWVAPGMHCFNWDVGTDLPDIEGCSYQIEIDIFNETIEVLSIRDSIPWPDLEGITFDGEYLWMMGSIFGGDTSTFAQIDP